jgi:AAHS family 4-hydroxybenzoate transporter-like MFS transporter
MAADAKSIIASHLPYDRFAPLQWRVIGICALVMFLDGFDGLVIGFVAPFIAEDWGLTVGQLSMVFTVSSAGIALGYFTVGPIADRFGRRPVILATVLAFGLLTVASAASRNINDLLVLRAAAGIALGAAIPNIVALLFEFSPPKYRAGLVSMLFAIYACGVAASGAVTRAIAPEVGWQSVLLLGGGVAVALGLALIAFLPESIEFLAHKGTDLPRATRLLRQIVPGLPDGWHAGLSAARGKEKLPVMMLFQEGRAPISILIIIAVALNQAEVVVLNSWLPTLLKTAGQQIEVAIKSAVVFQVGAICGNVSAGVAFIGRSSVQVLVLLVAAEVLAAGSLVGIGFSLHSVGLTMVLAFVSGLSIAFCLGGMHAVTTSYYTTAMRATGYGTAAAAGRITASLAPAFVGFLLTSGLVLSGVFAGIAAPLVVGAIAMFLLWRLHPRAA